jgi:hypothetical protein
LGLRVSATREPTFLDELEKRFASRDAAKPDIAKSDIWETSDFRCRKLADDVYLLTYNLIQDNKRHTRRCTIWQRTPQGWKIVYHQGTVVEAG